MISFSHPMPLMDEVVEVRVDNAPSQFTIQSQMLNQRGKTFQSPMFPCTSTNSTWRDSSMRLFSHMEPAAGRSCGQRLLPRDVSTPLKFVVTIYDCVTGRSLSSAVIERRWLDDGVERVPVDGVTVDGHTLFGTLFIPRHRGKHPGVVDLFGSGGGLFEFRAAALANRGVCALALAYFNYPPTDNKLPKLYSEADVHYIIAACKWLRAHGVVDGRRGVGVVAVSKGTEFALCAAALSPEIAAVVSISGQCSVTEGMIGAPCEPVTLSWAHAEEDDNALNLLKTYSFVPDEHQEIPVERIRPDGAIMFVSGSIDTNLPSARNADILISRLQRANWPGRVVNLVYEGAGHIIEPPYTPHVYTGYHGLLQQAVLFGGDLVAHAQAKEKSWPRILEFLRSSLCSASL